MTPLDLTGLPNDLGFDWLRLFYWLWAIATFAAVFIFIALLRKTWIEGKDNAEDQ